MKLPNSAIFVGMLAMLQISYAYAQDTLQIGYFNEWPLPAHYGQTSGAYDEMLGAKTNWQSFENSTAMFAALETGDIQIALSQGVVPFLLVATAGLKFDIVDIAVSYPDSENCVVHSDLGFSASKTSVLVGKTIGLPIGTTAHFNLLRQLDHLKISTASLKLVHMSPAQAAAALRQKNVDVACGWGPALSEMLTMGEPLTSGDQKLQLGGGNFDVITIRASFGADNPETVAQFLKVTASLNASFTANPAHMIAGIAGQANMTESTTNSSMAGFRFPTISEKAGPVWFGGGVQAYLKNLADFLALQGTIDKALSSYDIYIDASYLQSAAELPLVPSE